MLPELEMTGDHLRLLLRIFQITWDHLRLLLLEMTCDFISDYLRHYLSVIDLRSLEITFENISDKLWDITWAQLTWDDLRWLELEITFEIISQIITWDYFYFRSLEVTFDIISDYLRLLLLVITWDYFWNYLRLLKTLYLSLLLTFLIALNLLGFDSPEGLEETTWVLNKCYPWVLQLATTSNTSPHK